MNPQSHCLWPNCKTWCRDCIKGFDVLDHFVGYHQAKLQLGIISSGKMIFKVKLIPIRKGITLVEFPIVTVFNRANFIFVVMRSKIRHYFYVYYVDDGSDSRKFHAELNLFPTSPSVPIPMKKSEGKEIIFSSKLPIDYLFKSGNLHYVENKELKKYNQDNHFKFEIIFNELPEDKEDSSSSSSDSSCEENTQSHSELETIAGDQNLLPENAEIENQPTASTASGSGFNNFEKTQLQNQGDKIQPEKLDEHKTSLENVEANKNQSKIDGAVDSESSSSGLCVANRVTVKCPNCPREVLTITTKGKMTVTPLSVRGGQMSVITRQKKNSN